MGGFFVSYLAGREFVRMVKCCDVLEWNAMSTGYAVAEIDTLDLKIKGYRDYRLVCRYI